MNHYEELGVSQAATTAEIRQAYKSLVRVLHPDQQQDENLRRLSELQLRRLNHLFQVLSDPEQRRTYDQSLHQYLPALRHNGLSPQDLRQEVAWSDISRVRVRLSIKPGVVVWMLIGAIALGSVIFWMRSPEPDQPSPPSHDGLQASDPATPNREAPATLPKVPEVSEITARRAEALNDTMSKPAAQPEPIQGQQPIASEARRQSRKPDRAARAVPAPKAVVPAQAAVLRPVESENVVPTHARSAPPRFAIGAAGAADAPEAAPPQTLVALAPKAVDPPPAPAISKPPVSVSGKWLYVPRPDDGKKSLYPPEYIELRVNNRAGVLRGKYYGKYRVSDRAISSEIAFQFEGRQGESVSVLPWAGNNGSKGELRLKRLSDETIEVNWITTTFGKSNTLASGTAVLYRSDPP